MNVRTAAGAIWAAVIALAALAVVGVVALKMQPAVDEQLCRRDGTLAGHTLVLVDQTDPLSSTQAAELATEIRDLSSKMERYEKISIAIIGHELEVPPSYVFSMCNPGRDNQINQYLQTPSRQRRVFEESFQKPLDEVVNHFKEPVSAPESPIIETIANLTRLRDFNSTVPNRKLIMFSDLLQHSQLLDQYTEKQISFQDFTKSANSSSDTAANLKGATVDIFYLIRPATRKFQTPLHQRFWANYFRANGAAPVEWCAAGIASRSRGIIQCAEASNS